MSRMCGALPRGGRRRTARRRLIWRWCCPPTSSYRGAHLQTVARQQVSSINRRLAALRAFYKWAVQAERVARSPLTRAEAAAPAEARPAWACSIPAPNTLLQQALGNTGADRAGRDGKLTGHRAADPRDAALVTLMWKAGLRVSEWPRSIRMISILPAVGKARRWCGWARAARPGVCRSMRA